MFDALGTGIGFLSYAPTQTTIKYPKCHQQTSVCSHASCSCAPRNNITCFDCSLSSPLHDEGVRHSITSEITTNKNYHEQHCGASSTIHGKDVVPAYRLNLCLSFLHDFQYLSLVFCYKLQIDINTGPVRVMSVSRWGWRWRRTRFLHTPSSFAQTSLTGSAL